MQITKYRPRGIIRWPGWDLLDEDWPNFDDNSGLAVYETKDEVVVEARVPGVSEDEVDIDYQDRNLTIRANHQETEEKKKEKRVVYQSASETSYAYSTRIPCPVNPKKIEAELKNGVLTIKLGKAEEARPTKIRVKSNK